MSYWKELLLSQLFKSVCSSVGLLIIHTGKTVRLVFFRAILTSKYVFACPSRTCTPYYLNDTNRKITLVNKNSKGRQQSSTNFTSIKCKAEEEGSLEFRLRDPLFNMSVETQIMVIAILPSVISPLSIIGSAGIIYMLCIRGEKHRLYHRIMFCISVFDIITSSMSMLGPMPVPEATGAFLAKGNTASCSAQGFFMQLTFTTGAYSACLMLAFLLMGRSEGKEETIPLHYEKFVHGTAVGFPIITGIFGVALGLFNPVPSLALQRCYIAAYPPDCDITEDVKCTRGANARAFLLFFFFIPNLILLICLLACTFLIWWTVRQQDRKARHSQYNTRTTSRAVAVQSIIYGLFFFNTYAWLLIDPIVNLVTPHGGSSNFVVIVQLLSEFFYWSRGMFNFLIFLRPRYVRIRSIDSDQSALWACREAVFGRNLNEQRRSSNNTCT